MSDSLTKVKGTAQKLKVFPLPTLVLLPGGAMPLHIFEPRYRALVKDALATDGVFAIAGILPGFENDLQGSPPLEPICCAGTISLNEEMEDGHYNLVLVGVTRARIVNELPHTKLYREVEVELLPDGDVKPDEDVYLKTALMELIARVPQDVGQKLAQVASRTNGGALADLLTGAVIGDVARRYEVLNELDIPERIRRVTDDVMSIVSQLRPKKHEGLLN